METPLEKRVERLLDQLENPSLTTQEIEIIKGKIDYLMTLVPSAIRT
jgi:hypothetical protein